MLSAIGTILDSLIAFRISFPLVKEVNPPSSRLYIPQPSPSTIISGSKNTSPKELHTPLHNLYPECSESVSELSLSDSNSNIDALESSDIYPTWQHTLPLDISDSDSRLLSSVSDSGSIISKSSSALFSTPQQIPSSELSDSDSVLSCSTSGSVPRVPESPVKLESLVDSLSGLGNSLSSESLF